MTYTQYIFHNDTLMSKFKTKGDSLEDMFNIHCKPILLNALKKQNVSLHKQIHTYEEYCNSIKFLHLENNSDKRLFGSISFP